MKKIGNRKTFRCPYLELKALGLLDKIKQSFRQDISQQLVCRQLYETISPLERSLIGDRDSVRKYCLCPYAYNADIEVCRRDRALEKIANKYKRSRMGNPLPVPH